MPTHFTVFYQRVKKTDGTFSPSQSTYTKESYAYKQFYQVLASYIDHPDYSHIEVYLANSNGVVLEAKALDNVEAGE